jgi:hypothetical protein
VHPQSSRRGTLLSLPRGRADTPCACPVLRGASRIRGTATRSTTRLRSPNHLWVRSML